MRIEANILQTCNAVCDHCNKAVGYADGLLPRMSVEQVRRAVDQLLNQNVNVRRLTVCGGEPILHPQLQEILDEFGRLSPTLRRGGGRVLTNGMPRTQARRDAIRMPPKFRWVVNPLDNPDDPRSGKNDPSRRPNKRAHSPFWISPADLGMASNFESCGVRTWCGAGLDSSGWSMCGKAVMLGKLLGIDPTMREGDIEQHINTPVNEICKHCQYGLTGDRQRPGKGQPLENIQAYQIRQAHAAGDLPDVSPTFEKAFCEFHQKGPLIQLEEL